MDENVDSIYVLIHFMVPKKRKILRVLEELTRLLGEGPRDRSLGVSLRVFSVATEGTMCPGVDSTSKNGYQENSWG
jgi:hypothetical protein